MLCFLQEFCPLASTKLVESGAQLILPHVPLAMRRRNNMTGSNVNASTRRSAFDDCLRQASCRSCNAIREALWKRPLNRFWETSSRLIVSNASQQRSSNESVSIGRLCGIWCTSSVIPAHTLVESLTNADSNPVTRASYAAAAFKRRS